DAEGVKHVRGRLDVRQRIERRKGVVVLLEIDLREPGEKTGALVKRRVGADGLDRRERALVIALLVVDVPHRETRAIERRLPGEGGLEVVDGRRGRLGEQPLDVVLECRYGWMTGDDLRGRLRRRQRDAPRNSREHREELRQRTAIDDVDLDAPRIERDAARPNDEDVVLELQRSEHDLRGA